MKDKREYWIAFSMVRGIGSVRFQALLDYFGDPQVAWHAPADALRAAGLSEKVVQNLVQLRADLVPEKALERIQTLGLMVLTLQDESYPRRLREIEQPPPVLYLRGELLPEDDWSVAVVGTRRVTPYGRQVTEEIAAMLARNGVTVVSGLARGVDGLAHQAALQAGGRTLAVLGCGLDQVYPPENRRLAGQIEAQGALISDYSPGTPPEAANFPARNRLISGLSLAVAVVEAGKTSGALITATFAAEQGREVFAVPGNITAPQSQGTNRLIYDGARPLLDPKEILEALELTQLPQQRAARVILPSDGLEAQLFETLGPEPLHIDEIRARTDLPIEQVASALAIMELKGLVRQVGGMNYVALREAQEGYSIGE